MNTIAFIGAGNMAAALIGGLIEDGYASGHIIASDPSQEKVDQLASKWGIKATIDNDEAINTADIVVIAVKPQVMESVLTQIQGTLQSRRPMIISVAAGIDLYSLNAWSGEGLPIVRCMPNTPSLVQQGASGLFANDVVSQSQKDSAQAILQAVGICVWVKSEAEIDAVIAVSGSGPAYYFLFMEAMIEAGTKLGLSQETATQLTLKTALGAATMANQSNDSPSELRRKVTSPNGTTEQAINTFICDGLPQIVDKAMIACRDRSMAMSHELGAKKSSD